ncbi:AIPR family protein [Streptomyces sp. NPDC059564]|uniref:AIPR family protein n=1 Tax=Streptomyces sp. NPDC059564 TaxID=3346865 RepID=UPI0036782FBD
MSGNTGSGAPQIGYVSDSLRREFDGLIDLSDHATRSESQRQAAFLSRALAARAARLVSGIGAVEAADCVIDGSDDQGIDAVAVSRETSEIWLVQAKWSDRGEARLSTENALKMAEGLRTLTDLQYESFNHRFHRLSERVDGVLASSACKIHLVMAVAGDGHLPAEASSLLSEAMASYNTFGEIVDTRVLAISDFHSAALRDTAPPPIDLALTLVDGFHVTPNPHLAYSGTVSAVEPAEWYAQYGTGLFDRNIRQYLGPTPVNRSLISTLVTTPETFWYFNNGITLMCDSVSTTGVAFGRRPARLVLHNAQVVNGAQTVAAIAHAHEEAPDQVSQARVAVRVVCVGDAPGDLATRVSTATNAQNRVEPQDSVALDAQQALIREDFLTSLGKEYVYRRGVLPPLPDAGCTVVEAATALACAFPDPTLVAGLRRDSSSLWDAAPDGVYARLFAPRPPAAEIWRSVRLLREVNGALHAAALGLAGRAVAVAERGSLLIAHIVFRELGRDRADGPGGDVPELTRQVLSHLTGAVDALFGPRVFLNNVFVSPERCRELADAVGHALLTGQDSPESAWRPPHREPRRPNAVGLLVGHGRIPDGAQVVYRPGPAEESAFGEWLNADPRRFLATWVNDARRPLVWAADGKQYSPSGLVRLIWDESGRRNAPAAVAGTRYWAIPGEGTLDQLAHELSEVSETSAGDNNDAN